MLEHRDVTGVLLHFSREQIESLMESMPPEQRCLSGVLATTITQPHEIWKRWVADESSQGHWRNVRSYLQFLDLSATDVGVPFGVAIIQFAYDTRWQLTNVGLVLGTEDQVTTRVNRDVRCGSLEYSTSQRH